jgi:hypothetical protein
MKAFIAPSGRTATPSPAVRRDVPGFITPN